MANVTMAQVKKMNAAMADGWSVDFQRLVLWNEKTAERRTEPDKNGVIYEASLHYIDERTGEGWSAKTTGNKLVELTVKKLTPAESNDSDSDTAIYHVEYLKDKIIGEPKTKKMFNYIQKLTHEIDFNEVIKEAIGEQDTAEEAPEPVKIDENSEVTEGMRFADADGKTFEITELNDMSVTFNGGERSLFDFGTSRTIKSVLDALGNGAKLTSNGNGTTENTDGDSIIKDIVNSVAELEKIENETAAEFNTKVEKKTAEMFPEDKSKSEQIKKGLTAIIDECSEATTTENKDKPQTGAPTAPDYTALAKAFLTGKQAPPTKRKSEPQAKTEEPTTEEPKPERATVPTATDKTPGYNGETSKALTAEEIEKLTNGEQVKKETENHKTTWTAIPYTDKTMLVYNQSHYQSVYASGDFLDPGDDLRYCGWITDKAFYSNSNIDIQTALCEDIANAILKAIPDEATAEKNAANISDYDRKQADEAKEYDRTRSAQEAFYKGEAPELCLYYSHDRFTQEQLIKYIESPAETVKAFSDDFMENSAASILKEWIRYNRTAEAYNKIIDDDSNEAHLLKRISRSVDEEKTVRIELSNGEIVKVEAKGVKSITNGGYISDWNVIAADRDKLPKNEYNRPDDIKAADIKAIYHGQRVLYRAA